jgi:hypothetical protein
VVRGFDNFGAVFALAHANVALLPKGCWDLQSCGVLLVHEH